MKNVLLFLALLICPIANAQDTPVTRDQMAQELEKTQRLLEIYHVNAYAYRDSLEVTAYLHHIVSSAPEIMSQLDAYRYLNQFVCFFNDGHTRLYGPHFSTCREQGGLFIPIQVDIERGELEITQSQDPSLIGQRIHSINGVLASELLKSMESHASRETLALDWALIARNFPYYFWLAEGRSETFHVVTDQGAVELAGVRHEDIPVSIENQTEGESIVHFEILEGRIAYLRVADFHSMGRRGFRNAFDEAFSYFRENGATDNLILDIRNHDGGDARYGEDLARYFADGEFRSFAYSFWKATPQFKEVFKQVYIPGPIRWATGLIKGFNHHTRAIYNTPDYENARVEYPWVKPFSNRRQFQGSVHLLIDQHTFSAGTCFAAMFQDFNMGIIYGQPSGNLASFHADAMLRSSMEHSNTRLHISTSYCVRPSGDESPSPVQPDVWVEGDALNFLLDRLKGDSPLSGEEGLTR
ncbi:MAG: S41 family peptidase [Bacteroidota bacterium]